MLNHTTIADTSTWHKIIYNTTGTLQLLDHMFYENVSSMYDIENNLSLISLLPKNI